MVRVKPTATSRLRFSQAIELDCNYIAFELQDRQVMILRLAIAAWRKDHDGSFPETLEELKPTYLAQIPVDPVSGKSFQYYSAGMPLTSERNPYEDKFAFQRTEAQVEARRTPPCLYVAPPEVASKGISRTGSFFELTTGAGLKPWEKRRKALLR